MRLVTACGEQTRDVHKFGREVGCATAQPGVLA